MKSDSPIQIDVMSSDLAFISAHAAAELDDYVSGRGCELEHLKWLSDALSNSCAEFIKTSEEKTGRRGFADPFTTNVLRKACGDAYSSSVESIADLEGKASEISQLLVDLVRGDEPKNEKDAERAMSFCLALSNYSLVIRSQLRGEHHPPTIKR